MKIINLKIIYEIKRKRKLTINNQKNLIINKKIKL